MDDVNRVARKYLDAASGVIAVLTPQPSGKPVSSKSFGGAESLAGSPNGPVALPSWAQHAVTRLDDSGADDPSDGNRAAQRNPADRAAGVDQQFGDRAVGTSKTTPTSRCPPGQEGVSSVLDAAFSHTGRSRSIAWRFKRRWMISARTNPPGADFR